MRIVKQISSLEKVRLCDMLDYGEIHKKVLLKGERFSYQIAAKSEEEITGRVEIISDIAQYIKVYAVLNAVMDAPTIFGYDDADYITREPGLMPDILVPLCEHNNVWQLCINATALWVEINIPEDFTPGKHSVSIRMSNLEGAECEEVFTKNMEIEVIDKVISPQRFLYSRWIHIDCIADYHNVPVYSDEHWALIEQYVKAAVDMGINLLMIPVHTPPLDTPIGEQRTCVQLVDIQKVNGKYEFSFKKFRKYVDLLRNNGIEYFQIAHMFSQWGAKFAPNIKVTQNSVCDYMFGWNTPADSPEYKEFLAQYIRAICEELKAEGILDRTYFSISDEPSLDNMSTYKVASDIIRSLIGKGKTIDALSNYEFYENGLVENPITVISHMHDFLEHRIDDQWAYFCNEPQTKFPNDFLAMPSSRLRIIGILFYKYGLKGFMHWGYNFYGSKISRYKINPYQTTSCAGRFPSGDPFVVYPSKDGAYPSLRSKVIYEALDDMKICDTLEKYIGREAVIKLIDDEAGMNVRFDSYPRDKRYLLGLREKMIDMIKNK